MMGKKQLIKEINEMRRLMDLTSINETTPEDQACIDQLEDDVGAKFIVKPEDECVSKLSCVIKAAKDAGKEELAKTTLHKGNCITTLNVGRRNLTMWGDKGTNMKKGIQFTYVFQDDQITSIHDKPIHKFLFYGSWDCDGSGNAIYKDIEFDSLVLDNKDSKPPTDFTTSAGWDIKGYWERNVGSMASGNIKDVISKLF